MKSRKLVLSRESIVELDNDQMRALSGGEPPPTQGLSCEHCPTIPLNHCSAVCTVLNCA